MIKLSVIIPSYKDHLLQKTIDSFLENSRLLDEVEVIVVIDGFLLEIPLKEDPRVKVIHLEKNQGMRGAINAGLKEAKGEFVMKVDSHCAFGPGFDKIMIENCKENWLLIPRRYSLDEVNFTKNELRPIRDYHYFSFPEKGKYGHIISIIDWGHKTRNKTNPKYDIDDTMAFQGSCWMANREYFMKKVGFLDDRRETYGSFAGDQLEIGLKYWLNGGEVKVNKKTWYAHLSKTKRHYNEGIYHKTFKNNHHTIASFQWSTKHWMNDEEPNMMHPFSWLVEKFWPISHWPENWKEVWGSYKL